MNIPKIIFIVGPTAVGKSDVALSVAQAIHGEIISCDAMQVYREISIANNKPSPEMLRAVPHHLVDVVSVEQEFDVVLFNQLATEAIRDVHRRERIPVVVGGSGMYMQILLDGIFEGGEKDPAVRRSLEERARQNGNADLYEELQRADPAAAAKIHPQDTKRLVRALEVYLTTKRPISELRRERSGLWGKYPVALFGLDRNRQEVYDRINRRVDQMIENGVVDEVKKLADRRLSLTAQRIMGIAEIQAFLRGEHDLEQAKYLIKLHTRHLAKRQWTWFRKEKRLQWLMMTAEESPRDVAQKIFAALKI